jgi:hypothetical protein
MDEVYLHFTICLHGMERDNFTLPFTMGEGVGRKKTQTV